MDELRDLAKKHTIEKLALPEGTQFNYETMDVIASTDKENKDDLYSVKVTVHSQDSSGDFTDNIYTLVYKKHNNKHSSQDRFELISFE